MKFDPDTVMLIGVGDGDDLEVFKEFYPRARFIGAEPLREHHRKLKERWLWSRDDLLRCAIGGTPERKRRLHGNYQADQRSTLYPMMIPLPDEPVIHTKVITLEQLWEKTKPKGDILVWLDVEGAEAEVFGAVPADLNKVLLEQVKWINTEWTFLNPRPAAALYDDVDHVLQLLGFKLFAVHSPSANGRQIDAVYVSGQAHYDRTVAVCERQIKRKQARERARTKLVEQKRRERRERRENVVK